MVTQRVCYAFRVNNAGTETTRVPVFQVGMPSNLIIMVPLLLLIHCSSPMS
ncbi:MAG: hypothetical protein QXP58_08445 [Thermoprotei archaeon]